MNFLKQTIKQPTALSAITAAMTTPVGLAITAVGVVGLTLYNVTRKETVQNGSDGAKNEKDEALQTVQPTAQEAVNSTVQTANKPLSGEYSEEEKRLIISEAMSMLGKRSGEARRGE